MAGVRFEQESRGLLDQEDSDGALSAPELPIARRKERGCIVVCILLCSSAHNVQTKYRNINTT